MFFILFFFFFACITMYTFSNLTFYNIKTKSKTKTYIIHPHTYTQLYRVGRTSNQWNATCESFIEWWSIEKSQINVIGLFQRKLNLKKVCKRPAGNCSNERVWGSHAIPWRHLLPFKRTVAQTSIIAFMLCTPRKYVWQKGPWRILMPYKVCLIISRQVSRW